MDHIKKARLKRAFFSFEKKVEQATSSLARVNKNRTAWSAMQIRLTTWNDKKELGAEYEF